MAASIPFSRSTTLRHFVQWSPWVIAFIALALATVILWASVGVHVADFSDAWVIYHAVEWGLPPVDMQSSRPFHLLAFHIAHALTPSSFLGANLLVITLLWGKACLIYGLVRWLVPQVPLLALFTAALYIMFPSDTGVFWIGAINIHLNTFCYFLAVFLLVWYWRNPNLLKLLGMWGTLMVAFTYEANYPLILVTPLLLVCLNKRVSRRVLFVSGLWYVVPVFMLARLVILYSQGSGSFAYQLSLAEVGLGSNDAVREMLSSVVRIYERNLAFIWVEVIENLRGNFNHNHAAIGGIAGVAVAVAGLFHPMDSDQKPHPGLALQLIGTGVALIGLGFAAYLPTEFRDTNYRVFHLSAAGGALSLASFMYLITCASTTVRRILFVLAMSTVFVLSSRLSIAASLAGGSVLLVLRRRVLYLLVMSGFVLVGALALLRQHQLYADMTLRQQWIMEAMARQAPSLDGNSVVVLLDDTADLRGFQAFEWRRDVFTAAIGFLYAQPGLRSALCAPQTEMWGYFSEQCAFREDGLWVKWDRGEEIIPYRQLVLFQYSDSEGAELQDEIPRQIIPGIPASEYVPDERIDSSAPLPPRLDTLFVNVPFAAQPLQIEFSQLR